VRRRPGPRVLPSLGFGRPRELLGVGEMRLLEREPREVYRVLDEDTLLAGLGAEQLAQPGPTNSPARSRGTSRAAVRAAVIGGIVGLASVAGVRVIEAVNGHGNTLAHPDGPAAISSPTVGLAPRRGAGVDTQRARRPALSIKAHETRAWLDRGTGVPARRNPSGSRPEVAIAAPATSGASHGEVEFGFEQ